MQEPFIPKNELQTRLQKLERLLSKNSALLLLSNPKIYRSSDIEFPFRQDSNFWYFTAINEPNSAFLAVKNKDGKFSNYLFISKIDLKQAIWAGEGLDFDLAREISGADLVLDFNQILTRIEKIIPKNSTLYLNQDNLNQKILFTEIKQKLLIQKKLKIENSAVIVKNLRMFKSSWELEQMQKAIQISTTAHEAIAKKLNVDFKAKKELNEFQIEAEILLNFQTAGANWAYFPIVAGGPNATVLHYVKNNSPLKKGDLLLIDAGCEYNYYASDLTRVYPLGTKFNSQQKEIYELVLKANQKVIKTLQNSKTGTLTIKDLDQISVEVLVDGMIDLGIFKQKKDEILAKELFKKYYPHGVGHFLGLDTHDIAEALDYKDRFLEPGMVITVEPGLYFAQTEENFKQYQNIGIRIEDNILITENGAKNLSFSLKK